MKIPDSVTRSTDKTMAKRKTKGQTVNYKTLHRKLLIEEQESLFTKNKMKETATKINFRRFYYDNSTEYIFFHTFFLLALDK